VRGASCAVRKSMALFVRTTHVAPRTMMTRRLQYLLLLLILLLAFALRVYRIDASALRGDEAFAVRYWAAPPAEVLAGLAWVEPHPFGTFFGFWAWKSLVGDSELAMRMLPALLNLLGVAAMVALARRLRMGTWAALLAAFLWAVNPGLIWHSQDVRNYAPWAGLSAVALWLLVRAAEKNRRVDWALYVVVEVITLYVFFLEAFMLVVHGLYVLWLVWGRRTSPLNPLSEQRGDFAVVRSFFASVAVIIVLLIPWLYQAYRLAGSGYGGTAERASLRYLFDFGVEWVLAVPGSLNIDFVFSGVTCVLGIFILVLMALFVFFWYRVLASKSAFLSGSMLVLLPLLLSIVSTRMDVFRARYILVIAPALILLLVAMIFLTGDRLWRRLFALLLGSILVINAGNLFYYYNGGVPKAPDWRVLRDTLNAEVGAGDALVLVGADDRGTIDPAFEFYYQGEYQVLPRSSVDVVDADLLNLLNEHQTVYLVDQGNSFVGGRLRENGVFVGEQWEGGLRVSRFRSPEVQPGEIQHPLDLAVERGQIEGWSLEGDINRQEPLYFLLYWATPITQDGVTWKVFVHLLDASGQIAGQGDLPTSGVAGREIYPIERIGFAPGEYTLRFGLYREDTGERAIITDAATGAVLGDYVDLGTISVAAGE
jgi:4-amino-4-deoxy-L-arabinose transferase-like glycosyltransferase